MNTQSSYRRISFWERTLIINKKVQWGLIGYSVFLAISVMASQYLLETITIEGPPNEWMQRYPQGYVYCVFGLVFIFFILILFYGMYLTNKIAGPIFRMKEHIENITDGKERNDLEFRKGDYFHEILAPYNKMIKNIKKH